MAQIENTADMRKGRSFSHNKKQIIRIDMTPMVDLGFLLITFFVFTTTMSTPKATDLFMPKDPTNNKDSTKIIDDLALTLLLDEDNGVYYYNGTFDNAARSNTIFQTNYSTYEGIGKIIRQKQKDIDASGKFADGRKGMMLLIKPTSKSVYKNVIDALDETVINDVKKYAIVEPTADELQFLKAQKASRQ
ncbi:MAG TPA: biopolymer transporter ExbD [Chitinophagaceae bacterium]|nr:biopolymer transporter ExbD [Chitinophagaceae bacterium]